MPGPRNPSGATRFALELDGTVVGLPASAAGGDAVGEVVVEPSGVDGVRRKHLGAVRYTDIVLRCGVGMEKAFWSWLSDTLAGTGQPRDGALRLFGADGKERERATFTGALVTEIGWPALDGSSRDPFQLTVRIAPGHVERERGGGGNVPVSPKAKQALASNFAVELGDLNLKRVARVAPLIVRRPVTEEALGAVEIPDLELTLAEVGSESVADWHRTFVVEGDNGQAREKAGSISLLDPAGKRTVLRLDLAGVGIFALERAPAASADAVARLTARMYCEEMRLAPGPQA